MPRLLFVLVCTLILCPLSLEAGDDSSRILLNTIYPSSSLPTRGAAKFAETVRLFTGGTLDIQLTPAEESGYRGPELLAAVKNNTVAMSDILMGAVSRSERAFGISSLPLIAQTHDEARELYNISRPLYEQRCAKWGVVFLYAIPWPPSGLFATAPTKSLSDLKGLRVRTYDTNGAAFLARAGAAPIPIPWGDLPQSLAEGALDAVLTSAASGVDATLWNRLPHFLDFGYAFPLNMLVINRSVFDALPPGQQEAMLRAARETEEAQWKAAQKENAVALKQIQDNGVTVSRPNAALLRELDQTAKALVEEFIWRSAPEERRVVQRYLRDRPWR